jgi:hypothetical protein
MGMCISLLACTRTRTTDQLCHPSQDEIFLNGTIVLPHKEIKESQLDPGTIIM